MLVRVVPGARGEVAINHYLDSYRSTTVLANTPTSLVNFGEAVNFPLIFGAMLAVVGAATLTHLLLALIGIIVGVPLGVVVGRAIWKAFANNLGAVPVSVVPIWLLGVLAAGVIVVANLLAIGPALVATRSKPARLLQAPQLNAV